MVTIPEKQKIKLSNRVDVEKGRVEKLKEVDNVHLITGLVKMFFK